MSLEDSKVGVADKRKEATFIASGLDNLASADKIIEFLEGNHKKNDVYTLYSQTVRQRRTTAGKYLDTKHFLLVGHPLNVFSEDWDGGLQRGYFETFSHKSQLPKMLTTIRNIEKKDPVTELMKKKQTWHDTLNDYRRIMSLMSKKRKYEWINDEVLQCPKQLVEIAAHYEQDPDLYFDSSYNWYYAGHGNMMIIYINGIEYLVHSEFNYLYISHFDKFNLVISNEDIITKFDCGKDLNILETIVSQNIVVLRTRHKIFVLKILEVDASLQTEKLKEMESTLPFTGISFDEYHKNILYVITLDYNLTIVNIDRMTGRSRQLRGSVKSLADNWSTVLGSERGYFTHVSKQAITLYDKRTNTAFQRWKSVRSITDDIACNDISVACHAIDKRLLYFGTDHHLFLMDLRYNKVEKNKLKVVQRWTHGMQCVPTYMSVRPFDYNKELICLSSQWCEDMCVVSNYKDRLTRHNDISSVTMPYRPPSILQTLKEAREKSICCDVTNSLDNRLCTSITGLSVIEHDDKYNILMLNSLGDISCHTLCPKDMMVFFEDMGPELLSEWSKSYKRETQDLEVSSIMDISNVWKQLKQVPDDYKFGENPYNKKVEKFSEQEINDAIEKEEHIAELLETWKSPGEETKNESSFNLFFSED